MSSSWKFGVRATTLTAPPAVGIGYNSRVLARPVADKQYLPRHRPALDGLRGLAVLLVVIAHAGTPLFRLGGIGVDVFFVLSGYLITSLLIEEHRRTGRISFLKFYMRRALRLLPLLCLVVSLYVVLALSLHLQLKREVAGDALMAMTYVSNWTRAFWGRPFILGHTWSLSVEEQFYLVWPLIVSSICARFKGAKGLRTCLLFAIGLTAWRLALFHAGSSYQRLYNGSDTRGDSLMIGAAVAFSVGQVPRLPASILGWTSLPLLLLMAHGWMLVNGIWWFSLTSAVSAVLLLGLLGDDEGALSRILSATWLSWIGQISYGIYLIHYPIMYYLDHFRGWDSWGVLMFGGPLSIGLAAASYYLYESPFLKLKRFFR
jgi:peptidoglycan/LPS O-acetylase OafA/YrhL